MNAYAKLVADTAPKPELDASFERMIERHGLRALNVGINEYAEGDRSYSAAAHRDHYCGLGHGDTIAEAVARALADLNSKASLIPLAGELVS